MQIDDEIDDFGEFDEDETFEFSPVYEQLAPDEVVKRRFSAKEAFLNQEFLTQQGFPEPPPPPEPQLTYAEKNEALNICLREI